MNMRSTWIPLILLLLYLLLMCLLYRVLDFLLYYQQGISPTAIVDPIMLSVRQLKLLLEYRGVSYTGYIEKQELVELVEASADILQGELDEISEVFGVGNDKERPQPTHFTGSDHFYEQVEDTKDSVWLVQVVPAGKSRNEPLLDDYNWRIIQNQVAPFAIRTGVFDCKLDRRLCNSKGWHEPLLLLALPRGTKPKDKVVMRIFTSPRLQVIMKWLREQLSIRVQKISNIEELEQDWLHNQNVLATDRFRDIKVLLLTHLLHPPLFLAALSIKFTGRIKFGMLTVKKEDSEAVTKRLNLRSPCYLIITPERTVVYGQRRGEHFHYWAMNTLLRIVQPEMNDVFVCSLVLFNMIAVLQAVQISMELSWKGMASTVWTVVRYNLWLFFIWLLVLGVQRWFVVSLVVDTSLVLIRSLGLSDVGNILYLGCHWCITNPIVFILTFFPFAIITKSYRGGSYIEEEGESLTWWGLLPLDCLFRPITTFNRPPTQHDFFHEDARIIEHLMERLARPDLWLRPTVPVECFIKDLPVWEFQIKQEKRSHQRKSSLETLTKLMDGETSLWNRYDTATEKSDEDSCGCPVQGMILTNECAICLEIYCKGVLICGLPCGHIYHEKCVMCWFHTDNNHCPICRWPVYKTNHPRTRVNFDSREIEGSS